jgi:hypothetical protein
MDTIAQLNDYTKKIWSNMTIGSSGDFRQYEFLISKTEVNINEYADILAQSYKKAGIAFPHYEKNSKLTLLRLFIMNPFIAEWENMPRLFSERLFEVAVKALE